MLSCGGSWSGIMVLFSGVCRKLCQPASKSGCTFSRVQRAERLVQVVFLLVLRGPWSHGAGVTGLLVLSRASQTRPTLKQPNDYGTC